MPSPEPPYRVIAAHIRDRISSGDLQPGDRVPSIRHIAQRRGVAVATATKVIDTLRAEGLVETRVGSGTVVSARKSRHRPARPITAHHTQRTRRPDTTGPDSLRTLLVRRAIAVADAEGLDAVTMRRLAAELGTGPMSLYRHVADKDELLTCMADEAFAELDLPTPGVHGWRADLEHIARRQWQLCRRHIWLPAVISFARPRLAPNMMAQTEWVLQALDGLGLPDEIRMREALALHSLVLAHALPAAQETEAEHDTGLTLGRWWATARDRADELLDTGRYPMLASIHGETATDLDGQFDYGLARHLDGFAALLT